MGRNLFIKEESTTGNANFIHHKGEKDHESNPFPDAAYFQENASDDITNPEDAIKRFRFSDDGRQLVVMTDDNGNAKHDSAGDEILFPGKTPKELQGITFKHRFEDCTIKRVTVLEPFNNNLENENGKQLLEDFKIRYNSNQVEDTIAYNEIMN